MAICFELVRGEMNGEEVAEIVGSKFLELLILLQRQ